MDKIRDKRVEFEFKKELATIEEFFECDILPIISSFNDCQKQGVKSIIRLIDEKIEKINNFNLYHRQVGVYERIIEKTMINNKWKPESRDKFFEELNDLYKYK